MEKDQRLDFKQEIGAERQAAERKKEEAKAEELEKRKKIEFKKVGRTSMVRSLKPTIKKQEVK